MKSRCAIQPTGYEAIANTKLRYYRWVHGTVRTETDNMEGLGLIEEIEVNVKEGCNVAMVDSVAVVVAGFSTPSHQAWVSHPVSSV